MPDLVIGYRVTYHGSITEAHGRAFLLLPCAWFEDCEKCGHDDDNQARYTLYDPATGQSLNHARAASVTPHPFQQPDGAVPITIGEYRYLASHTAPGGSSRARIVYFHLADEAAGAGRLGATWCYFREMTSEIRALDEKARARAGHGPAAVATWARKDAW